MGYYHTCLNEEENYLCTIILPRGNYWYKHLPMGVSSTPDIFQEKINEKFDGFEFIRTYKDDLLIITKGDWSYNLEKLEPTIQKIKYNRLHCHIEESLFGQTDMEYLGLWVTRNGI